MFVWCLLGANLLLVWCLCGACAVLARCLVCACCGVCSVRVLYFVVACFVHVWGLFDVLVLLVYVAKLDRSPPPGYANAFESNQAMVMQPLR